jgi:hypothetical protein
LPASTSGTTGWHRRHRLTAGELQTQPLEGALDPLKLAPVLDHDLATQMRLYAGLLSDKALAQRSTLRVDWPPETDAPA